VSRGRLPGWLRPLARLDGALAWLLAYPLLSLQLLLVLLVSWGGLGASLGVEDLFWHENPLTQASVGLAAGLLFGEIFFVRYLLDPRRARFRCRFTLFPVREPGIARLGEYLLLFWPAGLLLLAGPRLLTASFREGRAPAWPLFAGLAASVLLAVGLVLLSERLGVRQRLQDSWLFRLLPGVKFGYLRPPDYPLHALALELGLAFLAAVVVVYLLYLRLTFTPVVALCLLLAAFNAVYGFLAFHLRGFQHLAVAALLALAVLFNSDALDALWHRDPLDRDAAYKLRFPNLEPSYARGQRVRLDEDAQHHDHYRELLHKEKDHEVPAPDLIPGVEPLRAMHERWEQHHPGQKPRLVLVAVSGGGIRAAVWTAIVLEGLEEKIPDLRGHVRLFTGASGGMVAAALYVADFGRATPVGLGPFDPATGLGRNFSERLAQDSLSRTVQTALLYDLPSLWWPTAVSWDRGRELESEWARATAPPGGTSPLRKTFADLKGQEREGLCPSLVFSPMLVEDSRRLLISNLDLEDVTRTWADQLSFTPTEISPEKPMLSLSAVEFQRLFPTATRFEVGTAARMNASFPFVSPGVSLPTVPPRRVVDAGYYDNFGTNLAAVWLYRHRAEVREHTSGVVLIEIRAYRNGYARRHFQDAEAKAPRTGVVTDAPAGDAGVGWEGSDKELLTQSLEWLSTPLEAVLTARERAAYYRNDELLHLLDAEFNAGADPPYFTSVAFECSQDAALSWTLPRAEAADLVKGFWTDNRRAEMQPWVEKRVGALAEWLKDGGR
jgi:hypothetical protein